mmetsp:Transcript_25367/g.45936  ORF Transcript_25367/g.45936 Transcript_25367/m.45936 type:complete len:92 (+) Transcript_25367:881-1156(+)
MEINNRLYSVCMVMTAYKKECRNQIWWTMLKQLLRGGNHEVSLVHDSAERNEENICKLRGEYGIELSVIAPNTKKKPECGMVVEINFPITH